HCSSEPLQVSSVIPLALSVHLQSDIGVRAWHLIKKSILYRSFIFMDRIREYKSKQ
ncbi:hypothetical protein DBR06_SOUSAS20010075, partial [Sousa chinensis]